MAAASTAWVAAAVSAAITALSALCLKAANNLSDLASPSTARTNLGLGGAAVLNVGTTSGTVAAGNSTITVGTTSISLGSASTVIAGLTSVAVTATSGGGLKVSSGAAADAVSITTTSSGAAITETCSGTSVGLEISTSANAAGVYVTHSVGYGIQLVNSSGNYAIYIGTSSTGGGVEVVNDGSGRGIYIYHRGTDTGLRVYSSSTGLAFDCDGSIYRPVISSSAAATQYKYSRSVRVCSAALTLTLDAAALSAGVSFTVLSRNVAVTLVPSTGTALIYYGAALSASVTIPATKSKFDVFSDGTYWYVG